MYDVAHPAHPRRAVPSDLQAPRAHLAGRPRRPARPRRARHASRRATTSASPDAHAARERRRVPRRPRRRPRPAAAILMAAQRPRASATASTRSASSGASTATGGSAGVVVEVHNTYGDRHAYLVHPDEQGRARIDKADVRLAVPRHRRLLRPRACRCRATTCCVAVDACTPTTARSFTRARWTGRRTRRVAAAGRTRPHSRGAALIRVHGDRAVGAPAAGPAPTRPPRSAHGGVR